MTAKFVICIDNSEYKVSLEKGKVYQVMKDKQAENRGLLRIIDESGEDYLFSKDYFVEIMLPQAAAKALSVN
jgi:hypothetical protein